MIYILHHMCISMYISHIHTHTHIYTHIYRKQYDIHIVTLYLSLSLTLTHARAHTHITGDELPAVHAGTIQVRGSRARADSNIRPCGGLNNHGAVDCTAEAC